MTSEDFYVEAPNGRFRRVLNEGDDLERRWRLPTRAKRNYSSDSARSNADDGELGAQMMVRVAFVGFLFLQGLLSGLSLSALYEALTEGVIAQYSQYFFIGITICVTGTLTSLLEEDAIANALGALKGGNTLNSTTKGNISLLLLYFVALIMTLLCSRASNEERLSTGMRGLSSARSFLCIFCWLVSSYQFVQERGKSN